MSGLQQKVRTCWWFDGNGHEAAAFYVSLLPDSRIDLEVRPRNFRMTLVNVSD